MCVFDYKATISHTDTHSTVHTSSLIHCAWKKVAHISIQQPLGNPWKVSWMLLGKRSEQNVSFDFLVIWDNLNPARMLIHLLQYHAVSAHDTGLNQSRFTVIYKPGWHTQRLSQGLLRKFSQLWLFGLCVQGMCLHNAHLGFFFFHFTAGPKESWKHALRFFLFINFFFHYKPVFKIFSIVCLTLGRFIWNIIIKIQKCIQCYVKLHNIKR